MRFDEDTQADVDDARKAIKKLEKEYSRYMWVGFVIAGAMTFLLDDQRFSLSGVTLIAVVVGALVILAAIAETRTEILKMELRMIYRSGSRIEDSF